MKRKGKHILADTYRVQQEAQVKIIIEMQQLPKNREQFYGVLDSFLKDFEEKGQREERWIGDPPVSFMIVEH